MKSNGSVQAVNSKRIKLTDRQRRYLKIKEAIDFLLALIGLVLLLPFFLIIATVLKVESPYETVLFKQERVGQHGKTFLLYKFRTMKRDAPPEMPTADFVNREEYITKLGRLLRRTSIDELPQLYNIIRGEMAFLGPRPLILCETEIHDQRMYYGIYQVKPGLSGLAQIHGRDRLNGTRKVLLDREYVSNISLLMDILLFFRTIAAVVQRDGIADGTK